MSYFIPISQLNTQSVLTFEDFFPLVTSSSLTTYQVDLQTLYDFLDLPQISCSWTSKSLNSCYTTTASYPPHPQVSMSWASQSFSSSYSITASWSPTVIQPVQLSCSLSTTTSFSSSYVITASWAPESTAPNYISMSWATQSISSSYAITASWAPVASTSRNPITYLSSPIIIRALSSYVSGAIYNNIKYVVNPSNVPYTTGVILQSVASGGPGAAGYFYASSSIMTKQLIGGAAHATSTSLFFVNVGGNNSIEISFVNNSFSTVIPSWGVNLIGYY